MKSIISKACFRLKSACVRSIAVFLMGFCSVVFAADTTLGTIASNIYTTFDTLTQLITAGSYIIGIGFSIAAIMKFKMHKDNPTQVPIGTPIALTFIAAALLFLPSILGVTGATIFGSSAEVSGPSGTIIC